MANWTLVVVSPEGASCAKPAFRAFPFWGKQMPNRQLDESRKNDRLRESADAPASKERETEDIISFLGSPLTQTDYQAICQNLAEYFAILRTWQEKENSGEKEENL